MSGSIDDAARALGIDLLPWQRDVGQRILNGENVVMVRSPRAGRATLRRVLDKAIELTAVTCGNEVDFHDDGCTTTCDREPDHSGWHSFTGSSAIQSWENR